ncbi:unnamed protein product [Musa textilis]
MIMCASGNDASRKWMMFQLRASFVIVESGSSTAVSLICRWSFTTNEIVICIGSRIQTCKHVLVATATRD